MPQTPGPDPRALTPRDPDRAQARHVDGILVEELAQVMLKYCSSARCLLDVLAFAAYPLQLLASRHVVVLQLASAVHIFSFLKAPYLSRVPSGVPLRRIRARRAHSRPLAVVEPD